ncbi:MAG: FecR family protein [Pirellulaceae bacterium]
MDGDGARARFAYADGSEFILAGNSDLRLDTAQAKELFLRHGTLRATVARQPRDQPMIVRTSGAEATVMGTSFIMNAANVETLLQVTSGAVKFRRLSDDHAVTVLADQQIRASQTTGTLQAESISPPPTRWLAESSNKACEWLGVWEGNILKAAPRTVYLKGAGVEETHFHAGARNSFPGLVELRKGSLIRIRYRIDRPLNVGLFISTHAASWDFTGNFQAYVEERNTPPDEDGWRTTSVPIGSLTPMARTALPFEPGCVASTIYATTFADDVGLEVAELLVISQDHE